MHRPYTRSRVVVAVSVLLAALPVTPAAGQGSAEAALKTYLLTMPNIRKMVKAYENLDAALRANPALKNKAAKGEDATSLDNLIAKYEKEPAIRQSYSSAGITVREGVLTQFALLSAGLNAYVVKQGGKPESTPAAAANLKLYQQNEKEIDQITAKLKTLASWQDEEGDDDSDESDQE